MRFPVLTITLAMAFSAFRRTSSCAARYWAWSLRRAVSSGAATSRNVASRRPRFHAFEETATHTKGAQAWIEARQDGQNGTRLRDMPEQMTA